ncbi:MAG: S9 family peptidase [Cyclobacteriaceae bacterium]|nr:S9 family peptidase [Cyclobacteriaceae bacterium]MCH8515956.1 S9 family peptidase [Cyclobacteriaceae bacterium]
MLRKGIYTIFILMLGCWSVKAQEATQAFDYLDIFELQYVSDPQISPDGKQIVYVRNQFDVMTDRKYTNLWLMSADGKTHEALSTGKVSHFSPRWSPDGKRLAYLSARDGKVQLIVRWMESGNESAITNMAQSPSGIKWSPNGKYIAFTANVSAGKKHKVDLPSPPKGADWAKGPVVIDQAKYKADGNFDFLEPSFRHIFIASTAGGSVRQITSGDYDHTLPDWTPDSKHLIYSANRTASADLDPNDSHIWKQAITSSSQPEQLTSGRGPNRAPVVSPDGSQIVFNSFEDRFVGYQLSRVFVMDIDGNNRRELDHGFDRDLSSFVWTADGKQVFAQYTDQGSGKLAVIDLKTGKAEEITKNIGGTSFGRPYMGGDLSINAKGEYAFTLTSTDRPAELAVGNRRNKGKDMQLTTLNETFLSSRKLGKVEEIWFPSSFDGKDIHGWVVYPPDFDESKKYPLILEIHGGPHLAYGPHFTAEIQLMAAKGYVVLYTNPRGSTTYGEEFGGYINQNYPSEDYDDLMSGVDAVIEKGVIDEDRLYITGGSGGGVLTAWSIGKTDRFAAAVVSKPVINWYSFALTADGYPFYQKYWFDKKPWEDPMQYLDRSPISLVGNVTTPTMLVTGEQDFRTPMSETEQYYGALRVQGVESMMVRIQGAGHGITTRPSNLFRHVGYILSWFEKYPGDQGK